MSASELYSVDFTFTEDKAWQSHECNELDEGLTSTSLFCPDGNSMGPFTGRFSSSLAKGVYRARVKKYGQTQDTLFAVDEGVKAVKLDVPRRHSALPAGANVGTHEYYSGKFISRDYTRERLMTSPELCNLSIFIRMRDEGVAQSLGERDLFEGLYMTDSEGQLLTFFNKDELDYSYQYGYARFRVQLRSGFYRLYSEWNGRVQWLPLHVFPHRNCDIAMLWDGKPLFSTMVTFFPYPGWDGASLASSNFEGQAQSIDAVIQTLSSGFRNPNISARLVSYLLNQKFDDPMLGIIGLHLVLLGKTPEKTDIATILGRLHNLLPDSPDVEALHYIAFEKGLVDRKIWCFKDIPILRLGAQAMQRALSEDVSPDASVNTIPPMAADFFFGFTNYSVWAQSQMQRLKIPWLRHHPFSGAVFVLRQKEPQWLVNEVKQALAANAQQKNPQKLDSLAVSLANRFQVLLPSVKSILNTFEEEPPAPLTV